MSARSKAALRDVLFIACDPRVSDAEVRLWLLYRRHHVEADAGAYVSDSRAASLLGWSLRKVQAVRADLKARGLLDVQLRGPAPAAYFPLPPAHLKQESQPVAKHESQGTAKHEPQASHNASQEASQNPARTLKDLSRSTMKASSRIEWAVTLLRDALERQFGDDVVEPSGMVEGLQRLDAADGLSAEVVDELCARLKRTREAPRSWRWFEAVIRREDFGEAVHRATYDDEEEEYDNWTGVGQGWRDEPVRAKRRGGGAQSIGQILKAATDALQPRQGDRPATDPRENVGDASKEVA